MALQTPFRRQPNVSRRGFVTGCGALALAATAGCTDIANRLADLALGDVNLFNNTDRTVGGTITVDDSAGETILSESFELTPSSDGDGDGDADGGDGDDGTNGGDHTAYDDVWTGAGTYEARVELDDPAGEQAVAASSVPIETPDEEMLAAVIGPEGSDSPIEFRVGEELSEFAEE